MDVPAYQIGGVFLLAALFMYGTSVSGLFPKLSGHGRKVGSVIALAGLVALAIHYAPDAIEQARTAWIGKTKAEPAPPAPAQSSPEPRPHSVKPAVPAPREAKAAAADPARYGIITAVPDGLPDAKPKAETPAQAVDPAGTDAYDSRLKHAAKSVGRFLHVVPKHKE